MTGELWDAPNQEVVRPSRRPPPEGVGAGVPPPDGQPPPDPEPEPEPEPELDAMTKDQLLAYAQSLGVSPANAGMTKEELRAGVDAKLAGGT